MVVLLNLVLFLSPSVQICLVNVLVLQRLKNNNLFFSCLFSLLKNLHTVKKSNGNKWFFLYCSVYFPLSTSPVASNNIVT